MITKVKAEILCNKNIKIEEILLELKKLVFSLILDEYRELLNFNELKPYTMNIQREDEKYLFIINCMTKEALDYIVVPFLKKVEEDISIEYKGEIIKIGNVKVVRTTYDNLIAQTYLSKDNHNYITINFKTPTSFKSFDKYIFYPDISLIYKSIIKKYNAFSTDYEIEDDNIVNFIIENTRVIDYNLKSNRFHLGKNKIPSFTGSIRIKIHGPETNKNLINLLLNFSEYSGVGIKTSLGMGGIEIRY